MAIPTLTMMPLVVDALFEVAQPWYGTEFTEEDWVWPDEEDMYVVYRGWPNVAGDNTPDQLIVGFSDDPTQPSVRSNLSGGDLARKSEGEIITCDNEIGIFSGDNGNEGIEYVQNKAFSLLHLFHTRLKANHRLIFEDYPKGLAMRSAITSFEFAHYPINEGAGCIIDFTVTVQTNTSHGGVDG